MWVLWGLGAFPVLAQAVPSEPLTPPPPPATSVVLDVPYLPQSVLLCGGAAIAMVERWWGKRGVYAEDFADLVRPSLGGIRTTDLEAATRARGWDVQGVRGTADLVRRSLDDGVPVVALIQVARDRYHYVVVIQWTGRGVRFHDPARAPHVTMTESEFLRRWTEADRWALVIRPVVSEVGPPAPSTAPSLELSDSMPCRPWLDQAVDAATTDRLGEAERLLGVAARACPSEPLIERELAGVHFRRGRYADAVRAASGYLRRAPDDTVGWQLLATGRYLEGDRDGALRAWNRTGRPTVDIIRIEGTRRIRFRSLIDGLGLSPDVLLTAGRIGRARRRVADVPALRRGVVDYQPVPGDLAEIRVGVAERPVVEPAGRLVASGVIRAVAQDEVTFEVATPTGAGELWSAQWRWKQARPRLSIGAALPTTVGLPGVLSIEGSWERVRIGRDPAGTAVQEDSRRSTVVEFGSWVTAGVRPAAALRFDRWSGNRMYVGVLMGGSGLAAQDRLAWRATTEYSVALSRQRSFLKSGAQVRWVSSADIGRPVWSARMGLDWVSPHGPVGTWSVAGGNQSWAIPLRAQALTRNGLLPGRRVGRAIVHAGVSGDYPVQRLGPLGLAVGVFLDGAHVAHAADPTDSDGFYLDGGAGLRIGAPGGQLGMLQIDVARGLLAEHRWALTVGIRSPRPAIP